MYQRSTVTMSMRELDRLKVIQAVVGGELRAGLAAERLSITKRQVRRLAERYRADGPVGLISRLRNRPSNRRLQEPLENHIARILGNGYPDFGPTLAMETALRAAADCGRKGNGAQSLTPSGVSAGTWRWIPCYNELRRR